MALLLPDDPPKGRKNRGLPVRERGLLTPDIPAAAAGRAGRRRPPPAPAMRQDAARVSDRATELEAIRSEAARQSVEDRREVQNRSVPMSVKAKNMQEAIAQAVGYWSAQAAGAGKDQYDPVAAEKAMTIMDFMFMPPTDEAHRDAIRSWSLDSEASYADMPPGAGYSETLAAVLPIAGDGQAIRDIKRDFHNGEVSFWTAMDALSLIPLAGAMFGLIRKGGDAGKLADALHDAMKAAEAAGVSKETWLRTEQLRRIGGLEGADLTEALIKEGFPAEEARAAASVGKEGPQDFIGGKPRESVIGAGKVDYGDPRITDLRSIRQADPAAFDAVFFPVNDLSFAKIMDAEGNMYAFRKGPMTIHADALHEAGLDLDEFLEAGGIRVGDFQNLEARKPPTEAQQRAMAKAIRGDSEGHGLTVDLIDPNNGGFLEEFKLTSAGDVAKLPERIETRLAPPKAPAAGHAMGLKVEDLRFEQPTTARRFEAAVRTGPDAEPVTGLNHSMAAGAAGVGPQDYAQVERGWVFTDAKGNKHFMTPLEAKEAVQVVRQGQEPDLGEIRRMFAPEPAPAAPPPVEPPAPPAVAAGTPDDPGRRAFSEGKFAADVPVTVEPAHRKFMRMTDAELAEENALRQQHGVEPMTRERLQEIEAGFQRRQSPKPYGEVSLAPMDVERRVGGEGAEAFKRAYADDLEVTDADRAIAMKHNEMIAERNLKDPDLGTTSALDGGELKGRYILSPGKSWETRIKTADGTITPQQVAAFRKAHGEALQGNGLGTWWDPKTGEVVFDVSKATDDVSEAGRVAVSARQDGIYDSETGKFIATENIPREYPGGPLFERPDKRITNTTPLSQGETVNSFAAKLAGMTLMRGTSIDDALDWAETVFGPEIRLWEDELVPRIGRLRDRWVEKLPDIDERMLKAFEKGSQHFEEDWYSSILPTAKELFGEELGPIWARLYAYTSAGADATSANITFANKGLAQHALGLPIETGLYPSTSGPLIARALEDMDSPVPVRHADAKGGIAAAKLKEFDENISFGGDRAIIDMWQSRLAQDVLARHGKSKKFDSVTPEAYQVIQGATEGVARREGIGNKAFQAGTWAGTKMDWDDPAPLITGGEALMRHPGSRLLPDEKTGILLPSFTGPKGRPVTYREKYGIPSALLGGYLGAGAARGSRGLLDDEETPALFRDPRRGLL